MCRIAIGSAVHQEFAALLAWGGDAACPPARRDADDPGAAGAQSRRRRAEPLQGALMRVTPPRVNT
jgi:hypothetical protein